MDWLEGTNVGINNINVERTKAVAMEIEAIGKERNGMNNWIKVSEKLPKEGIEVWCFDLDREVIIGIYNGRFGWSDIYGDNDGLGDNTLYNVTHWMVLKEPLPPQGRNK